MKRLKGLKDCYDSFYIKEEDNGDLTVFIQGIPAFTMTESIAVDFYIELGKYVYSKRPPLRKQYIKGEDEEEE